MIDTHCHLSFEEFDNKREEIIENTRKEFKYIVDSGASYKGNIRSLKVASQYNGFIKTTMGYHPEYAGNDNKETINKTLKQISDNIDNIQAIGEIGLDFSVK